MSLTVITVMFAILTNISVLYRVVILNRGFRLKPEVGFLIVLFFIFIINRSVFLSDFFFNESPNYYNLGNAQNLNKSKVVTLLLYMVPATLFSYISAILGYSYKRSLYIGLPFLLAPILQFVGFNNFLVYANLPFLGVLHLVLSIGYSIVVIGYIIKARSMISELLFAWIFSCLYAYNNVLLKLISGYLYPDSYSPVNEASHILTANTLIIFIDLALLIKGQRILTGDLRAEQKMQLHKKLSSKEEPDLAWHNTFRIWNLNNNLSKISRLSDRERELLENNKAAYIYKITQAEIDFVQAKRDFKFLQNPFYFSQELGVESKLIDVIFESFCRFSFSEYSKLMRVMKADFLIRQGFLKSSDVDSLAERSYFNNRITLYNNFKKFFGTSISKHKKEIELTTSLD